MGCLYFYPKESAPWRAVLDADCVSIGRARDNTIVLADPNCSSHQAVLERRDPGYFIRDAGSKNGTFVNGRRIEGPVPLTIGDEVQLGSTSAVYDRPKMPRITLVDSPRKGIDSGTRIPFREILEGTSGTIEKTATAAAADELLEANRILKVVVQVSEALVAHKPLQELLQDILDLVAAQLPMDQCMIMLRAEGSGALEIRAAKTREEWSAGREIQVSRSIVAMAYEQHLSVLFADTAKDPRVSSQDSIIVKKIRSALCVPIGDQDEVIGVLYADRHGELSFFRDADLRLLTLLANTAAVKIQQSRQVARLVRYGQLQRELEVAANIQRDLLPRTIPPCGEFEIAGRAVPCSDVGGDYYDFVSLDRGRLGLAVADVSGKGVGAALLMASLRAWLRAELLHGTDLADLAAKLNSFVQASSDIHTFITFFFAELDPETGKLCFVNAGHNPPFILARDGAVRELAPGGLILGALAGSLYEVETAAVGPGEVLVLYTDGITESRKGGGEEFGVERLAAIVRDGRDNGALAIVEAVFRGVNQFADCGEPDEDRTLVIVKRGGCMA